MAVMCLSPFYGEREASFTHVLFSPYRPPIPNPILESQELQWFWLLVVMPILALEKNRPTTDNIEPFCVTVMLQRCPWANKLLPRVTTQWGVSVFLVSDQWVKRAGLHIDYNESDLSTDLHTEADLGEGCVPVSGQLGLLRVESSLPSSGVVFSFIAPVTRIIVKGTLGE